MKNVLVIIPAKDEEKTIGQIIERLKHKGFLNILVVNDCSSDDTCNIAKSNGVNVINLPFPMGTFGAISAGFFYAKKYNFDYVITIDADGQHNPEDALKLLKNLIEKKADLCIGTYPLRYSFFKKFAVKILKIVSGLKYEDILSGFRAYSNRLYTYLADKNFLLLEYQDIGILLTAKKLNMKIIEVEVTMKDRKYGKSRVYKSWPAVIRFMIFSIFWSIFKRW